MPKPQQQQQQQQAGVTRIPTVYLFISACGPKAMFPIKVDSKMMVEQLREQAKQLYATYCQDEGIPFTPPSNVASDYDIFPCIDEHGSYDELGEPWPEGAASRGTTIRDLLTKYIPPVYVSMVIGHKWIERNNLIQEESAARARRIEKRHRLMDEFYRLGQVSMEKYRALQLHRERQTSMVSRVEDALLLSYVEYRKTEAKIRKEHAILCRGYSLWKDQVKRYEAAFEDTLRVKRMAFSLAASAANLDEEVDRFHHSPTKQLLPVQRRR